MMDHTMEKLAWPWRAVCKHLSVASDPPTSDLAGQMLLGGDDLVHVGANNCLHGWPGQLELTQHLLKVHLGLFKYQAVYSIRDLWYNGGVGAWAED